MDGHASVNLTVPKSTTELSRRGSFGGEPTTIGADRNRFPILKNASLHTKVEDPHHAAAVLALDINFIALVEHGEMGRIGDGEVYRHRRHADLRVSAMRNRDATCWKIDLSHDDTHPRRFPGVRLQLLDALVPLDA